MTRNRLSIAAIVISLIALIGSIVPIADAVGTIFRFFDQGEARFYESAVNGTNYVAMKSPAALAGNLSVQLPVDAGAANQLLKTDGAGVLSWSPATTALEWKNVKDSGAVGDGVTDDTTAINSAISAVGASGGGIFFPPGTYLVSNFTATSKNRLILTGIGATIKRKPAGSPDTGKIATFTTCTDVAIYDLAFDVNNVERFGGFNFVTCNRVYITRCRAFDSNLNATWASFDHYWIVATTNCTDFWVIENHAKDVELAEIDNSQRVTISRNYSEAAAGTAAIVWASVSSAETCIDYKVEDNIVVDPRRTGISFQHETTGLNNNVIKRLSVRGNLVSHLTATAGDNNLIRLGNFTGQASSGNTYEDIRIEDNSLYVDASLTTRTTAHLFLIQQAGNSFTKTSVSRNTVYAKTSDIAIDLRRFSDSTVSGNRIHGATNGLSLSIVDGTFIQGNLVDASTQTYQVATSGGDNVFFGNEATGAGSFSLTFAASDISFYPSSDDKITTGDALESTFAGGKTTLALTSTGTDTGLTIGADTTLYRSAANLLKTDDDLEIGNGGGKTTLRLTSTAASTGITFGGDTNLYRATANLLRTDDDFSADARFMFGPATTLTIATGAVSASTGSYFRVDTESAAATDDLDTVNSGITGQILILQTVDAARDVVLKNEVGNLFNTGGVDLTLDTTDDVAVYIFAANLSGWHMIAYSNN